MMKVLLDEAPDARDMPEIDRLAVAHAEPREDADDLAVALRPEHGIGRAEGGAIELGKRIDITAQHGAREIGRHVAPRILEQRDEIVAARADDGVLEIDQAPGGDPSAALYH